MIWHDPGRECLEGVRRPDRVGAGVADHCTAVLCRLGRAVGLRQDDVSEDAAGRGKPGRILLDDQPLRAEPGPDRGVVFQRYSVFPHLTVLGNVLLGLEMTSRLTGRLYGAARRVAEVKAEAMLAEVGLTGAEGKYPAQLSGGMQQRLALAQALITGPRVLLLDEPFGALDPGIRAEMHGLMQRLWHSTDLTVVMVTHDLSEAFTLGSRVLAFERLRDRAAEKHRYGAVLSQDFTVWPPRVAGQPALKDTQ